MVHQVLKLICIHAHKLEPIKRKPPLRLTKLGRGEAVIIQFLV